MQRIVVHGYASEYEPIVSYVVPRFGMRQVPVGQGAGYLAHWKNQPIAGLHYRLRKTVRSQGIQAARRYETYVELNRPAVGNAISDEFVRRLPH